MSESLPGHVLGSEGVGSWGYPAARCEVELALPELVVPIPIVAALSPSVPTPTVVIIVPIIMSTSGTVGTTVVEIEDAHEQPTQTAAAASALATVITIEEVKEIIEHQVYLLRPGHKKTRPHPNG